MAAVSLMYHDVVPPGHPDASGFPTGDAAIYKLTDGDFRSHLDALRGLAVSLVPSPDSVFLTFDDGGSSFYDPIAPMLEERGWRGHFFISTDYIDTHGFLTTQQIRELHRRGHIIGSHSCSHPLRMAACTVEQLQREWSGSVLRLAQIVDAPITVASVPGGHFSESVAHTAAATGLRVLFTSEPTVRTYTVDGCEIRGRYAMYAKTPARDALALASGSVLPRWKQSAIWSTKKIVKRMMGPAYVKAREEILNRGRRAEN
jgi:peptidoglycan/xylan/chitin deacetylase (PgdA/CDA1 family)